MFDHIGFNVKDFSLSKNFYVNALAPLGITLISEGEGWAMVGKDGAKFWFGVFGTPPEGIHIAFSANTHEQVQAFYNAALLAGGLDNGKPGVREQYHPEYYAAFVIDPNGHNIEVVCHKHVN